MFSFVKQSKIVCIEIDKKYTILTEIPGTCNWCYVEQRHAQFRTAYDKPIRLYAGLASQVFSTSLGTFACGF